VLPAAVLQKAREEGESATYSAEKKKKRSPCCDLFLATSREREEKARWNPPISAGGKKKVEKAEV